MFVNMLSIHNKVCSQYFLTDLAICNIDAFVIPILFHAITLPGTDIFHYCEGMHCLLSLCMFCQLLCSLQSRMKLAEELKKVSRSLQETSAKKKVLFRKVSIASKGMQSKDSDCTVCACVLSIYQCNITAVNCWISCHTWGVLCIIIKYCMAIEGIVCFPLKVFTTLCFHHIVVVLVIKHFLHEIFSKMRHKLTALVFQFLHIDYIQLSEPSGIKLVYRYYGCLVLRSFACVWHQLIV